MNVSFDNRIGVTILVSLTIAVASYNLIPLEEATSRYRSRRLEDQKIDRVVSDIISKVEITGARAAKKLRNDLKLISLAGFIASSFPIPNEAVATCSIVFATANFRFIRPVYLHSGNVMLLKQSLMKLGWNT